MTSVGQKSAMTPGLCPKCQRGALNGVHSRTPDEASESSHRKLICPVCGYVTSRDPKYQLTTILRDHSSILIACAATVLFLLSLQVWRWKFYFVQATVLEAISAANLGNDSTDLEFASICNALRKFECSEMALRKIVDRAPNHRQALGNLALVLSSQKKWAEAKPIFEAYFSLGGSGYDVIFGYGKFLNEGAPEGKSLNEAMSWMMLALSLSPDKSNLATEIAQIYTADQRYFEVFSMFAALKDQDPTHMKLWRELEDRYRLKFVNSSEPKEREELRITSLNGQIFWIPILNSEGQLQSFPFVPKSSIFIMPYEFLAHKQGLTYESLGETVVVSSQSGKIDTKPVVIPTLRLGNWILKDMKVNVCESCLGEIGQEALGGEIKTASEELMRLKFLVIQRTPN